MKKVSIIVPCYNVEGYINNCLFSLCNQSLKDIEIIAVDDGSKDKTGSILDDYAKKYDNLVVIPVNHISNLCSKNRQLPFFGSEKRYSKFALQKDNIQNGRK